MNLHNINKAYFIGIGGIGMSALARYMNSQGIEVAGYDKTETNLTRKLVSENIDIHYTDDVTLLPDGIELVVYTPAIPGNHQELMFLRDLGIPVMKRAEVLGIISKNRRTVAVAGTHGKTTTSAILAHLLHSGGIDCTAFLGGIAVDFDSNYVEGKSDWVVVEADEYDRSFLHLRPYIAIILSMDADHLDIYGDSKEVVNSFRAFANCVKAGGLLLINEKCKDQLLAEDLMALQKKDIDIYSFGLESGDYAAKNIHIDKGQFVFDFEGPNEHIKDIALSLPGHHNTENATAALAVALHLGVKDEAAKSALASFKGIKRRFEIVYRDNSSVYIDDYAHHPSELEAAIAAARNLFPKRKITGIFQPHLFSRTRDFADGFARALDALDEIWLMDIYPAREIPIPGISSDTIFSRMANPSKRKIAKDDLLASLLKDKPEVLLTLGAGDIGTFVDLIKAQLSNE